MSSEEITNEVYQDFPYVQNSAKRLTKEYVIERRKKRIDPREIYSKSYHIKTHKKNPWTIMLCKPPGDLKYKDETTINYFTYYYTSKGIRVFRPDANISGSYEGLGVYNGHLFARYNERLNLGIINPLQKIETFFHNNGFAVIKRRTIDEKTFTIGLCHDGFMLGEIQNNGLWHVYKTFISRNEAKTDQVWLENSIRKELQETAIKMLHLDNVESELKYYTDIYRSVQ